MTDTSVRSNLSAKERILDAAERLISDFGIDGTSLRQITSLAEVNLAAVNYHFQSKDELVRAVYLRRLQPIGQERLSRLEGLEASGEAESLDALLDAFYVPVVAAVVQLAAQGISMPKIMGRAMTDPHPIVDRIFQEEVQPLALRFGRAFGKVLPHLSAKEVIWRMHLSMGLLAYALGTGRKVTMMSGGICQGDDMGEVLAQIKSFAKAGFGAPSEERAA